VLTIVEAGPGDLSLDHALGLRLEGTGWAIAALITGVVGAELLVERAATIEPEGATAPTTPESQPVAV
jgi:putative oxidoreductase